MFTQVYAAVRGRLREMKENDGDVAQPVPAVDLNNPTPGTSSASGSALPLPPPAKRARGTVSDSELYGSLMIEKDVQFDEVDRYIRMPESDIGDDSELLRWWQTQVSRPSHTRHSFRTVAVDIRLTHLRFVFF